MPADSPEHTGAVQYPPQPRGGAALSLPGAGLIEAEATPVAAPSFPVWQRRGSAMQSRPPLPGRKPRVPPRSIRATVR